MDKISFGAQLKNLRKSAKITQEKFAEKLNIHVQTVSKWERGISEPDLSLLGEIAEILNVSLERLAGVEEERTFTGSFDVGRLGEMLKRLRRSAGESQKDIAVCLAVSADTVSKWERGVICPSLDCLITLSAHFGISLSALYFAVPTEGKQPTATVAAPRNLKWLIPVVAVFLAAVIAVGAYFIFGFHKHVYGDWEVVKAGTCTEHGEQRRKCYRCEKYENRETDFEHEILHIPENPSWCEYSGVTDGIVCIRCNKQFKVQEAIPPLGHDIGDWGPADEIDYVGMEVRRCRRCNTIFETRPAAQ